jgi:glycosyltransferase involved in cell wall biosynthesis
LNRAPRISVVIPLYRDTRYLSQALESVAAQTVLSADPSSLEVLIVQDGEDLKIEGLIPESIKAITWCPVVPHAGVSAARNYGIQQAHGTWIAFLDADDVWLPEKLNRQLKAGAEPDISLVYTNTYWTDGEGRRRKRTQKAEYGELPSGRIAERLLERNYIITSSVLARKEALERAGGFDRSLEVCEDWDLWIRMARDGRVAAMQEPLAEYRMHGSGAHTRLEKMLECSLRLVEKNYREMGLPEGNGGRLNRLKSQVYQVLAGSAVFAGDPRLARQLLDDGEKIYPTDMRGDLVRLLSFLPEKTRQAALSLRDALPFLP